jgi:O-antigen/teichoic acid export membrane protein
VKKFINYFISEPFLARITKGASISLVVKILGILITYIFSYVISRNFGPEVLGLFFVSVTIVDIASTIAMMGLDQSIVLETKYQNTSSQNKDNLLFPAIISITAAAAVITLLLEIGIGFLLKTYYDSASLIYRFLPVISFSVLPITLTTVCANFHRKKHNMVRFASLLYLSTYLLALLALITGSHSGNYLTAAWAYLAGSTFTAIIALITVRREVASSLRERFTLRRTLDFIWFSLPFMGSDLLYGLFAWVVILASGMIFSAYEAGIFSLIFKMGFSLALFSTATNAVLLPSLVKSIAQRKQDRVVKELEFGWVINFGATLLAAVLLVALSPIILRMFGSSFEAGFVPMLIICCAQVLDSVVGVAPSLFSAFHKQKTLFSAGMIKTAVFILLIWIFKGRYSVNTLAGIVFGAVFVHTLYTLFASMRMMKQQPERQANSTAVK